MAYVRSFGGTLVFSILVCLHGIIFLNFLFALRAVRLISWPVMGASIIQSLAGLIFLTMLFVPLTKRPLRITVAIITLAVLLINCYGIYDVIWTEMVIQFLPLFVIFAEVMVIAALVLPPEHRLNIWTPFCYQEDQATCPV